MAHGLVWNDQNKQWTKIPAIMLDDEIAQEVISKSGVDINFLGLLSSRNLREVASGISDLAHFVGGFANFRNIFDGVKINYTHREGEYDRATDSITSGKYDQRSKTISIFLVKGEISRTTIVHEFAHHAGKSLNTPSGQPYEVAFPRGGKITQYGETNRSEYFAEAVTAALYVSYVDRESDKSLDGVNSQQSSWIKGMLNGWGPPQK